MRTFKNFAPALVAVVALPAGAAINPLGVASGTNAIGNTVYCVTNGTTGTEICLNNVDAANVGFNDPTAKAPQGGNGGTTIGEQRINTYIQAFNIWGGTLTSTQRIWVQGTFTPLACTATAGTLGAAGAIQINSFNGFYGYQAFWPSTWHKVALVNKLIDADAAPGPGGDPDAPDPGLLLAPFGDDIVSFFNSSLGTTGCLETRFWYYGYDNNEGANDIDFLSVLLHELGHGLGHANDIDENGSPNNCTNHGNCTSVPGAGPLGLPDLYTVFSREDSNGKHWNQMSDGERVASAVSNTLVWDGPNTTAAAAGWLIGPTLVRENSPTSVDYAANPASYGPLPTLAGTTADVVLYNDGVGADTHDACDCPFVGPGLCTNNAPFDANVAGKIALIVRGNCTFTLKTAVAESAGAIGVIVMNNVAAGFPGMGGADVFAAAIPSVGITQANGNAIRAELLSGPVNATILADASLGLQGADENGFVKLYAPTTFSSGSSVSHWDDTAFPNLMMEPSINADLKTATTLDISPAQMTDVGWEGYVNCPVGTDDSDTIVIDGCDSGVPNYPGPWTIFPTPKGKGAKRTSGQINGGCYLADMFHGCVGSTSHGDFVSCSTNTASTLVKLGVFSQGDADAVMNCVSGSDLP